MSHPTLKVRTKLSGVLMITAAFGLGALNITPGEADARAIPITSTYDPIWAAIDSGSLTTMHRVDPLDALPTEVLWASVEAGITVLEAPSG